MGRSRADVNVGTSLARLFRLRGYDGVALSEVVRETGLPKPSLYLRYPDGKAGMARAVLADARRAFSADAVFTGPGAPSAQLRRALERYYEGGALGCLLAAFALPSTVEPFGGELATLCDDVLQRIAQARRAAGATPSAARREAEDIFCSLQGALILATLRKEPALFRRLLRRLLP
jgi:TetR/AcrR family transcriptional regulator, lmrAB and yxaGH operons repressor